MAASRRSINRQTGRMARLGNATIERFRRIKQRMRLFTLAPFSRVPNMKNERDRLTSIAHRLAKEIIQLEADSLRREIQGEKGPISEKQFGALEHEAKVTCIEIGCNHAIKMAKLTPDEERNVRENFVSAQVEISRIEDASLRNMVSMQAVRALYTAIGKPRAKRLIRIYLIQQKEAENEMSRLTHRYIEGYANLADMFDPTRRTK